jgi:cytochrome c oxidase subunit II
VRRKLCVVGLAGLAVLLAAGIASAANGGFTPLDPYSPNVHRTNDAYYLILGFTAAIFVIVEASLVFFIWRYRSRGRPRTVEGAQVHGHTRLEIIWTVVPVVILAVIGTFVFYKLPGISDAPASPNPLRIKVEGHQFYWQFDYPNGARTINDLYVPVDQNVELTVVSADVVHSWWVPQLEGKIQAIPGRTNHIWFRAEREGTFYGQCAELCGIFHALMRARVIATTDQEFKSVLAKQAATTLGRAEFSGVCATCHGMQGQGGYGPALATNPLLTQTAGIESIIRNGRGKMPAVASTWTDAQVKALTQYVKSHVYKGGSASGG